MKKKSWNVQGRKFEGASQRLDAVVGYIAVDTVRWNHLNRMEPYRKAMLFNIVRLIFDAAWSRGRLIKHKKTIKGVTEIYK